MGTWSIGHWVVVLVIVMLLFGTKRLRNMGGDLGAALKDFRKGLQGDDVSNAQLKADPADPAKAQDNTKRENAKHD